MNAREIAEHLTPAMFPGAYSKESDIYPDLKRALQEAAGPSATVHVEQQDYNVIKPVRAFNQVWWPDGVVVLGERTIGVEAKLLRHEQESGSLASAVMQGMVLKLAYDEALIVLVRTGHTAPFSQQERDLFDRLWENNRIAWTAVVTQRDLAAVER